MAQHGSSPRRGDWGRGGIERVATLDHQRDRALRTSSVIAGAGATPLTPEHPEMFLDELESQSPPVDLLLVAAGPLAERALRLASAQPETPPVIVLHGAAEIPSVVDAMRRGAFDYLPEPVSAPDLERRVLAGAHEGRRRRRERESQRRCAELADALDERQRLLSRHIMQGMSNLQIARRWGVSERTIAGLRAKLLEAMDAANTADLVRRLMEGGLDPGEEPREPDDAPSKTNNNPSGAGSER